MAKVSFLDKRIFRQFLEVVSVISVVASLAFIFVEIPKDCKLAVGGIFLILLFSFMWLCGLDLTTCSRFTLISREVMSR